MRKLTLLGVGALSSIAIALSSIAIAFGPASPASAVVEPPGLVSEQVCAALPGGIAGLLNLESVNDSLLGLLGTDVAADNIDLLARTTDLVDAIVAHVQAIDAGGNTAATAAVVGARASAYADSAAAWTDDVKAVLDATLQALVIQMQQGVLGGIGTGLGCPLVVEG